MRRFLRYLFSAEKSYIYVSGPPCRVLDWTFWIQSPLQWLVTRMQHNSYLVLKCWGNNSVLKYVGKCIIIGLELYCIILSFLTPFHGLVCHIRDDCCVVLIWLLSTLPKMKLISFKTAFFPFLGSWILRQKSYIKVPTYNLLTNSTFTSLPRVRPRLLP